MPWLLLQVTVVAVVAVLCSTQAPSWAQRPPPTCDQQCPTSAPYKSTSITNDTTYIYVSTTMCPPYDNPRWTNPAKACIFEKTYKIPITQKFAKKPIPVAVADVRYENILYLKEDPAPILGAMGILKNGVNVFGVGSPCGYSSKCPEDGGPTKYVDAVESEGHTVDQCGGHAAPTHQYHIHSGVGLNTSSGREQCQLPVDKPGQHSELLGWMFDGFGLYGRYSEQGKLPTDLDECGGHTHAINGNSIYHYHMPDVFPWTIGCYKGCPEVSNNQHEFGYLEYTPEYGCENSM